MLVLIEGRKLFSQVYHKTSWRCTKPFVVWCTMLKEVINFNKNIYGLFLRGLGKTLKLKKSLVNLIK